jgi:threonyl-tRNA synthetase
MTEIRVRLPDGKTLAIPQGATVLSVAERIGPGLARAALAGRIDGRLVDLREPLVQDVTLEIVTARDPAAGEIVRHSAEHVMADAVKRLFPQAQIDVGRSDHSQKFQYDFLVERPFTPEDLERIEKEMGTIVAENASFSREVMTREQAQALFRDLGEDLKLSRLDDIPEGLEITVFRHGDFADLCRGPHVQRTDQIGAWKLLEVAGSYWRGDENNPMLQRVYGTAFATRRELEAHLERLEEARHRDHRRVGVALELFHVDAISPGSPFYLPRGVTLYNGLVEFMRSLYPRYGYQEVITPQLFRTELFKTSGHYELFRDDMFLMQGDEGEELGLKPMNCPGHCHLFSSRKHSYRELPIRYAEFSRLHRNERSGTLTGLSRVRSMAQDDGHITKRSDSRASRSPSRRGRRASRATRPIGTWPSARWWKPWSGRASPAPSSPATPPSTRRRWSSTSATCWTGRGRSPPSRPTSSCPPASACATSGATAASTDRLCSTGRSSAR